jgi:hypothetical protein
MILPANFANEVREGEDINFCPYCSRILFYEEVSEDQTEDYFDMDSAGSLAGLDEDFEDEDSEFNEDEDEETKMIDAEFKSDKVSLNGNPREISCHVDLNGNEYEELEDEDEEEEEESVYENSDKDVYIGDSDIPLVRYTGSNRIRVVKQSKMGW